jgi:hypothetical protein
VRDSKDSRVHPYQTIEGKGYVGQDCFGRVFFDRCESEEQHLVNPAMEPGAERPGCRLYLDDLMPKSFIGTNVRVTFTMRIEPCTEN